MLVGVGVLPGPGTRFGVGILLGPGAMLGVGTLVVGADIMVCAGSM